MSDLVGLSSVKRRSRPSDASAARRRDPGRLERFLLKKAGQAIADFAMIEPGDRIMACVSGGKDSYAMLDVLLRLQQRAPVRFDILAVNIDQGWPGYDTAAIAAHLAWQRPLREAAQAAHAYVRDAIVDAPGLGGGHGPLHHMTPWYDAEGHGRTTRSAEVPHG